MKKSSSKASSGSEQNKTRYELFKDILTKAAGNSTADYEGHGQFWNTLSLDELQEVSIYGVRMIAPKDEFGAGDEPWKQESGGGAFRPKDTDTPPPPSTTTNTEKKSCCTSFDDCGDGKGKETANTASDTPPYAGRAAASGLITALKGAFPFDGTHFTYMPFGGSMVSPTDLAFIESWIDDGCPDQMEQEGPSTPGPTTTSDPLSHGGAAHPPSSRPDLYHHENGGLKQRKNIQYLNTEELQKLRYAFQQLINLDPNELDKRSYTSWAKIHGDSCQHGWEQFLPWHRTFLYEFELLLQEYVPDVTLPYWDWTMPIYNEGKVPKGGVSGIIPPAYNCWIDQKALDNLKAAGFDTAVINALGTMENVFYNSGVELKWTAQEKLGAAYTEDLNTALMEQLKLTNPLWHRLRFPGMFYQKNKDGSFVLGPNGKPVLSGQGELGIEAFTHHHYPTADEVAGILELSNWADFGGGHFANQSFGMLSQNPHNTGHIWSGGENPEWNSSIPPSSLVTPQFGDMFTDLIAFFDPIAWGHHSNVDRLWWSWQQKHPGVNPSDLTDVMIPWHYTVQQLLDTSKLGYEYAKASVLYPTDSNMAMTKVLTQDSGIHNDVLNNHTKAEVRLHGLQRPVNSHYIRVFLNSPDANHQTPIKDNDNYVGYLARFGHGDCVGGAGHCDIPNPNRHRFDFRPRHHNTPTNHRFDATEQVKKLMANGAKDIHVNLVVIGPDGRMAEGQSRAAMNAVSLNFFE